MEIGRQIRKYRQELNMSQEELADHVLSQGRRYPTGRMIKIIRILTACFCSVLFSEFLWIFW